MDLFLKFYVDLKMKSILKYNLINMRKINYTCNSDLFQCNNEVEDNQELCPHCLEIENELNLIFNDYLIHEKSGLKIFYWQPTKDQQRNFPNTIEYITEEVIKKYKLNVDGHAYINPSLDFIKQINYQTNNK